jgi:hypothetical protein
MKTFSCNSSCASFAMWTGRNRILITSSDGLRDIEDGRSSTKWKRVRNFHFTPLNRSPTPPKPTSAIRVFWAASTSGGILCISFATRPTPSENMRNCKSEVTTHRCRYSHGRSSLGVSVTAAIRHRSVSSARISSVGGARCSWRQLQRRDIDTRVFGGHETRRTVDTGAGRLPSSHVAQAGGGAPLPARRMKGRI